MSAAPQRRISAERDLDVWRVSPAYAHLTDFIQAISAAVKGKLLTDPVDSSAVRIEKE